MRRGAFFAALVTALATAVTVAASCRGGDEPPISVTRVVAPAPVIVGRPSDATMAVYATIANRGDADTLVSVETSAARVALLHATMDHGGMAMMMPAEHLVVPEDSTVRLAPGQTHAMLEGLTRRFAPGDSVSLVFVFRRAGRVPAVARVVAYDQIERALTP